MYMIGGIKMRRSPLKTILCVLLLVFMTAFIWLIGTLLKDALPSNQNKNAAVTTDSVSTQRGPFTLVRVNEDVGNTLYTYFKIYSRSSEGESDELVYVCGRRFESLQVKSMAWADDGSYNIIVQMKDGTVHQYTFDNNAGWQ